MDIQKLKKKSELLKVQASAADMQIAIAEKKAEVERLEKHLEIQLAKEIELTQEIKKGE